MGHTLGEWTAKVAQLIRDPAGRDISLDIDAVGLRPAFARFSVDRPYEAQAEVQGAGSAYFSAPTGWIAGLSDVTQVEFPARRNPPQFLDNQEFVVTRDPTDVTVVKILLLSAAPSANQWVRFTFTGMWPYPGDDAAADVVDAVAFEAVSALAAAYCCLSLGVESARERVPRSNSETISDTERDASLLAAADRLERAYKRLLGIDDATGSGVAPASASFDFDPGRLSLFHGGRR